MNTRRILIGRLAVVFLTCGIVLAAPAAPSATPPEEAARAWPAAELTLGLQVRDSETEGIGDLLLPLWNPGGRGLLFLNPRSSFTDHSSEMYNLGAGYRQLLPGREVILGANIFYDYLESRAGRFNQWGAGLEVLTPWVDARANYYDPDSQRHLVARETASTSRQSVRTSADWRDPVAREHAIVQDYIVRRTVTTETSSRTYEQFQQPMRGHDWEIGLRLPVRVEGFEARVFGGYYDFDRDYGTDVRGWKLRAELRLASTLFLDAGIYENDELTGSDWFAGARLSVPLDLANLAQGRNPFSTARSRLNREPRDFSARLAEMIMRDPQIRIETTPLIENPALATQATDRRSIRTRRSLTLLPDVMFVHGDHGSSDGSAENPFRTIQQAADSVFGEQNIYVYNASGAYEENVVLSPGTTLWGSGSLIQGMGGKSFGSGIAPIVDGMSLGPAITMANRTTVRGLHVRNTDMGGPALYAAIPGHTAVDISRAGLFGDNATGLHVEENLLTGNSIGALFSRQGDFNLVFRDNASVANDAQGLWVAAAGNSGVFDLRIEGSSFFSNQDVGALIEAYNYDLSIASILDSSFVGNTQMGLHLLQTHSDEALTLLSNVAAILNGNNGIHIFQMNNSDSMLRVEDLSALHNSGRGMAIVQVDTFQAMAELDSVTASFNLTGGLFINQSGNFISEAMLNEFTAAGNGGAGILASQFNGFASVFAAQNSSIVANEGHGISIHQDQGAFIAGVILQDVGVVANTHGGIQLLQEQSGFNIANLESVLSVGNGTPEGGYAGISIEQSNGGWGMVQIEDSSSLTTIGGAGFDLRQENVEIGALVMANFAASNNDDGGIRVSILANQDASVHFLNGMANDNAGDGIAAQVFATDGTAEALFLNSTIGDLLDLAEIPENSDFNRLSASGNAGHGISLDLTGAATRAVFGGVDAYDNDGFGIRSAVLSTADDADVWFVDVGASQNGVGISLGLSAIDGNATAAFFDVGTHRNAGSGIELGVSSTDFAFALFGDVHSQFNDGHGLDVGLFAGEDAALAITESLFAENGGAGVTANLTAGRDAFVYVGSDALERIDEEFPFLEELGDVADLIDEGPVVLAANGEHGLDLVATPARNFLMVLNETLAIENDLQGARINVEAGGDVDFAVLYSAFDDNGYNADELLRGGLRMDAVADGTIGGIVAMSTFLRNSGNGLHLAMESREGDVFAAILGVEASQNGLNGVRLDALAHDGEMELYLMHVEANTNANNGIQLLMTGAGESALAAFRGTRTIGNSHEDLATRAGVLVEENYVGLVDINGQDMVSSGNLGQGVFLDMNNAAPRIDFGGGPVSSDGNNSFYDNSRRDFRFRDNGGSGATAFAQNNWWGTPVPDGGQFLGNVDWSDPLPSDPNAP